MPQGGIAAYLLGLLQSPLAETYTMRAVDVTVPDFFVRHRELRPLLTGVFWARLEMALRRFRPDLVHVHTSGYGGFYEKALLAGAAHAERIPVLFHLHGGNFDQFLQALPDRRRQLVIRSLSRAARTIVLSEAWKPLVSRFAPPERVVVLPNAIHCAEFAPALDRQPGPIPRLLFLGMLSARKGLDELLRALLEVRREGIEFTAEIVGGEEVPGERARYAALYRAAGLEDRVRFTGPLYGADKLAALRRADLFVLPSRAESFGIANLEAMAAGLPVVATRTGAIPEVVSDGVQGLLCEPGDAAGLAAALGRLLVDAELRHRLGRAARLRALDFDWQSVAERLGSLYRSVLEERRSSVRG